LRNTLECRQISNDTVEVTISFYGGRRSLATYKERFTIGITNVRNPPTTKFTDFFVIKQ